MRTALYFPHTAVRSQALIRTALLTWDRLEFIVPYEGFQSTYEDVDSARAMEIIGQPRTVTGDDQVQIHR